ncbi:hypothetical protein SODALDRAFT_328542 [Sodiomyces alkalinus F11]|uniref:Uncharacterized protein n=1 Tax=Sodiomyces alkalinus (strain CBS 110278 / VKM F-3762 / F11) TaxID=1314773 RepID=A0A3N2PPA2_SODAK|nr:hypothetical protein SODALDRAFT_328542 [Sodiomyces alkalinus F11]ROT36176.1 hypothetical protein SODALDRAFT_328542 [Sodiomyces alkalinus F11]
MRLSLPDVDKTQPLSHLSPRQERTTDGSLSSLQIGGILGGIFGFVILVLAIWFCTLHDARRRRHRQRRQRIYDSSTCSSSDTSHLESRRARRDRRPQPGPPRAKKPAAHVHFMPQPPPPTFHVNQAQPWAPKYGGPKRYYG